jgi:hypothetical protein
MLGVRIGLRASADDRQAAGCRGDRDLGALQQELPAQSPSGPAAHLRGVPGRAGECRLAAGKPGLHDLLTDEYVKARASASALFPVTTITPLTSRP